MFYSSWGHAKGLLLMDNDGPVGVARAPLLFSRHPPRASDSYASGQTRNDLYTNRITYIYIYTIYE